MLEKLSEEVSAVESCEKDVIRKSAGAIARIGAGDVFLRIRHAVTIEILFGIHWVAWIQAIKAFPTIGNAVAIAVDRSATVAGGRNLHGIDAPAGAAGGSVAAEPPAELHILILMPRREDSQSPDPWH